MFELLQVWHATNVVCLLAQEELHSTANEINRLQWFYRQMKWRAVKMKVSLSSLPLDEFEKGQ